MLIVNALILSRVPREGPPPRIRVNKEAKELIWKTLLPVMRQKNSRK